MIRIYVENIDDGDIWMTRWKMLVKKFKIVTKISISNVQHFCDLENGELIEKTVIDRLWE